MIEKKPTQARGPQTGCLRCATCCRKGGPSLHGDDRLLVEQGLIPAKHLFTIRRGETAWDNVRGALAPVERDHIKIKGTGSSWTCRYLDEGSGDCRIYERRPLECRLLRCWDTAALERVYGRNLLARRDLLGGIEGLWDLVADHESRCDYDKARRLIRSFNDDRRGEARRELTAMIRYDEEIRRLVLDRAGLDAEMLEFLFGRPMSRTLGALGLKMRL